MKRRWLGVAVLGLVGGRGAWAGCGSSIHDSCVVGGYAAPAYATPTYTAPSYAVPAYAPPVILEEVLVPAVEFRLNYPGVVLTPSIGAAPVAAPNSPSGTGVSPVAQPPTPAGGGAGGPASSPGPPTGRTLSDADLRALAGFLRASGNPEPESDQGPPPVAAWGQPGPAAAGPAVQGGGIEPQVLAGLAQSCSRCHGGGRSQGGVSLFDVGGSFHPLRHGQPLDRSEIAEAVQSGKMPKSGGIPLSPEVIASIGRW